jgi:hypothetical protein
MLLLRALKFGNSIRGQAFFAAIFVNLLGWPSLARASDIPQLVAVDSLKFYAPLTNETSQQATYKDPKLNFTGPLQLVGVTLGEQHSIAWLEQSSSDRTTRPTTETRGVRVMQMTFGSADREFPAVSCVGGDVGIQAQVRQLPITTSPNFLEYRYWDAPPNKSQSKPPSGEIRRFSYSSSSRGFIKAAPQNAASPKAEKLQELRPAALGQLELRNMTSAGGSSCKRDYRLQMADSGGLEIRGTAELVIGQTRIFYTDSLLIEGLTSELESAVQKSLAGTSVPEAKLFTNSNMICLWFPRESPQQALVIDLERMERELLLRLIVRTQELLNSFDFVEREFLQASFILGQLNLITRFATSIATELGRTEEARVKSAAAAATTALEELIFRLPVNVGDASWSLFYNARTNKGRLLPAEANWEPQSGKAYQLKIVNRPLGLVMILKSSTPMTVTSEELKRLMQQLSVDNNFEPFRTTDIQIGLPKQSTASLGRLEKTGDRKSTIKLQDFKVIQPDSIAVKLASSESDAQELRELYLRSVGLPLQISLESYFHNQRSEDQSATVECRVKAPDFKILTAQDQFLPVMVLVDAALFSKGLDEFSVRLRYPGESQEFTGVATRESGTATIEIPVRTKQAEVQLEIQYWSPGRQDWVTEPTGAEGLIIIER